MNENDQQDRPIDRVIGAADERGLSRKSQPNGYMIQCSNHLDRDPSLSVTEVPGRVLLFCHAGCRTADVLDGLGLSYRDLFDGEAPRLVAGTLVHEYVYRSVEGFEIGAVQRYEDPKSFRPMKPVGDHGWAMGASEELKRTPYRADGIRAAVVAGRTVMVVEGEADVDAAWALDYPATCNQGGAGQWRAEHAEHLRGADVVVVPDQDKAGRAHAEKVVKSLRGVARSVRVRNPAEGCKDLRDHLNAGYSVEELREPTDAPQIGAGVLVSLADVEAESLAWVWPGRLPVGKLATLDGDPSMGKSTLAVTFAAHISTGKPWPDGALCEGGDVVILSAEDGMADTIRPRLDAAGGDPSRVHMLTAITVQDDDGEITTRPPTLADVGAIRGVVERTGARLLVVDVLMAYLPGKVDSHRDQDIRAVLHRLAEMADQTGCTVLLLRHLNKSAGGSAMYRGGGSIGIVGAARAGYLVAPDPDNEGAAVLACVKSNLARTPESLSYRLESAPGTDVARVVWLGGSAQTAQTLLSVVRDDEQDETTVAGRWLLAFLDQPAWGGSAPFKDIAKAAKADDIAERTLRRAARSVGVTIDRKGGFGAGSRWHSPQENPERGRNGRNERAKPSGESVSPGQGTSPRSGQDQTVVTPFRPRVSPGQDHSGHSGQPEETPGDEDGRGRNDSTGCDYPFCESEQAVIYETPYHCRRCATHNPMLDNTDRSRSTP